MSVSEWPAPAESPVAAQPNRHLARKTAAVIALLFTLLMLVTTLTVPAIAASGPAILTVACGVLTWTLWPKKKA
jgi:hypothetical protein